MKNLLLVEDNESIVKGLSFTLESEGFEVSAAKSVAKAESLLFDGDFSIAIVDLMLPDGSGTDVVRLIKERFPETPVLILTARDDENDVVAGFDLGADDYMIKPFRNRELLSRIGNLLRRYKQSGAVLTAGDIRVDVDSSRVFRGEEEISLSALEYRILLLLMKNKGQTVSRERILDRIWDLAGNYVNDNTLTVYIKRIREKTGEDVIKTVKGLGYRVD
ncbi:MAG: response regulator transcription factor [Clostridia bacterium]|nr:response regulator transcription factor [Clostridia bacterium]